MARPEPSGPIQVSPSSRRYANASSIRFHNRRRLDGIWHQRYSQTNIRRSIALKASLFGWWRRRMLILMTKDQDLSFQQDPRPE
jgi:hypothetical protein